MNIVSKVLRCVVAGVKPALIGPPAGGESEIARCALLTAHYRMSCFEDINRSEVGRDIGPESKRFACFLYHDSAGHKCYKHSGVIIAEKFDVSTQAQRQRMLHERKDHSMISGFSSCANSKPGYHSRSSECGICIYYGNV